MAKSIKARFEGKLVTIPTPAGTGLAKVLFCSSYVKDAILLQVFEKVLPFGTELQEQQFSGKFQLRYSRAEALKTGRWPVFADQGVSADEIAMTKRISGGEVWIGDEHLGSANEEDERTLLEMLIYGERLMEKYVAGLTV